MWRLPVTFGGGAGMTNTFSGSTLDQSSPWSPVPSSERGRKLGCGSKWENSEGEDEGTAGTKKLHWRHHEYHAFSTTSGL